MCHYLKVRADFLPDGKVIPLMYRSPEDEKVIIDRVLDIRPAAALKAGGRGIRYTCRVQDHLVYLFLDREKWFMEDC